ncbi:transporter [Sphingomonas bacterium]|uniref:transporter n=1 Tax=Sphingomonas bacterium TaxID=1895847 RepID=UPI001574F274|nr:transporter [Sphingomonas bacterium]
MKHFLLFAGLLATPALAQDKDGPRFCPNRPSIGESGCTTEPGHVQLEMSLGDWTKDDSADQREDTVLIGDLQARFGLTRTAELQVAWTAFGHDRARDKIAGGIDRVNGVGDVQIGIRQNLRHPDGKGLSFAIEPSVTIPVGRQPIGGGDWGAGAVLPVTVDLTDQLQVQLTNEVAAEPDEDGDGRHFLSNEVAGLAIAVSDRVTVNAELQWQHDHDPSGHARPLLAAGSIAWQPRHGLQLDALAGAGLNRDAPDLRLLAGGAIVF